MAAFVSALTIVNGKPPPKPEAKKDDLACLKKENQADANCLFKLEVAKSEKQQVRGLSGRESMLPDQGMLFDFERRGEHCMWMKDMRFSLDLLWLNDKKEVIKVVHGVSPETYPTTYCANGTKYVIELNKGAAQSAGFDTGQRLSF